MDIINLVLHVYVCMYVYYEVTMQQSLIVDRNLSNNR